MGVVTEVESIILHDSTAHSKIGISISASGILIAAIRCFIPPTSCRIVNYHRRCVSLC